MGLGTQSISSSSSVLRSFRFNRQPNPISLIAETGWKSVPYFSNKKSTI
jgi:hypothetical protein